MPLRLTDRRDIEREAYDGYTLKELSRLAKALGYQLRLSFVTPDGATEPQS